MAYIPPAPDEEEEKKQPAISSGSMGSSPTMQPAGQAPTPTSSGQYVNLQSFLEANPTGRAQRISGLGGEVLGKEKSAFEEQANPRRNVQFNPTTLTKDQARDLLGQNTGGTDPNTGHGQGYISPAGLASNGGQPQTLENVLSSNEYTGPGAMDYKMNDDNTNTLASLTSPAGSVNATAKGAISAGGYTMGDRSLDEALLTSDPEARVAMSGVETGTKNFITSSGDEQGKINQHISDMIASGKSAREGNLAVLGGLQGDSYKALQDRASAANAREAQLLGQGNYVPGQATPENVETASEQAQFGELAKLLGGGPNPQQAATPYSPGGFQTPYGEDVSKKTQPTLDVYDPGHPFGFPKTEGRPTGKETPEQKKRRLANSDNIGIGKTSRSF